MQQQHDREHDDFWMYDQISTSWLSTFTGQPSGRPKITYGSLFTGVGAGHHALASTPHDFVFAVENDRHCCDLLRQLPNPPLVVQQDIRTVNMKHLPRVDMLLAAPPCQGFSKNGRNRGNDPRRNLYREVLRYVEANHPLVVVTECVVPFKGSPEHEDLVATLRGLKYFVQSRVLKAEEFGSKQRRHRVFVVGVKLHISHLFGYTTRTPEAFVHIPSSIPWPFETGLNQQTLGETILEDNVDEKFFLSERGLAYLERRRTSWGANEYHREDTSTMGTWCKSYGNNSVHYKHTIVEGDRKRKMTPLEVWRLMGWNYNPCTELSNTRSYEIAGNSIDMCCLRPLLTSCAERIQSLRAIHRRDIVEEHPYPMHKWQEEWNESNARGETDLSADGMHVALGAIGDALEMEDEEDAAALREALASPMSTESEGSDWESNRESDEES